MNTMEKIVAERDRARNTAQLFGDVRESLSAFEAKLRGARTILEATVRALRAPRALEFTLSDHFPHTSKSFMFARSSTLVSPLSKRWTFCPLARRWRPWLFQKTWLIDWAW